jgi:hypothetical protein
MFGFDFLQRQKQDFPGQVSDLKERFGDVVFTMVKVSGH